MSELATLGLHGGRVNTMVPVSINWDSLLLGPLLLEASLCTCEILVQGLRV